MDARVSTWLRHRLPADLAGGSGTTALGRRRQVSVSNCSTKPFSLWELVRDIAENETAWHPQKNLLGPGRSKDYQIKNRKQLAKLIKFKLQYKIKWACIQSTKWGAKSEKILRLLFCSGCFYVIGRHLILNPIHIYKIHEISFQYCIFKIELNCKFCWYKCFKPTRNVNASDTMQQNICEMFDQRNGKRLETQPLFLWYSAFIKYCGGAACFSYCML